jgi:hypothetical protein
MEFEPWPSISRLNKDAIYTEKIDGTNAAVVIEPYTTDTDKSKAVDVVSVDGDLYAVWAQSRKRFITPGDDNFAFALWVYDNAPALVRTLGVGRHFGEWWGKGIQGSYGLTTERRFSLFNVKRWEHTLDWNKGHELVPQLYMVPVLERSTFSTERAKELVHELRYTGSWASPGFMKPEGVVVFHTASQTPYKTFLENDDLHKFQVSGE